MNLLGKIALVTGASRGIGLEIAKKLSQNGATVIGTYRNHYIVDKENKMEYCKLNVVDSNECKEVIDYIVKKYGQIDILINNAGITSDALTKKMTEEQFNQVIDVNLKGTWNITKLVGPLMQERKYGSIVNVSSIIGEYGNIGQVNYAASKAGVIAMTLSWAKEFARKGENVRVNAVAPGYTMTDMLRTVPQDLLDKSARQTMLRRLAEPAEIANAVLFLASDMASYITGTVLDVNGGMRL